MSHATETEVFYPSTEVIEQANVPEYQKMYDYSVSHRKEFWADQADTLSWYKRWDTVLDETNAPFYKWFDGGSINIVHNAVDRHLENANRNKMAIIWEGENGQVRNYSYSGLNREVCQFANTLKSMGVNKGDIVTIYMPQIPELIFAMLACAKIGAIHSVVYGGFSTEALASRIDDAQSRVLVTADGGWRRGKPIDLKSIANDAMKRTPSIEVCICVKNNNLDVEMEPTRDFWLHDLKALPIASSKCETEQTDAEDPLFILYTSGTTGKPKGMLHTHGGYSVYTSTTHRMAFDIKPQDIWWCAADPGWITGHSYIVYGPLINGATIMLYEGAPNYPYPNRWWQIVEKYGVNIFDKENREQLKLNKLLKKAKNNNLSIVDIEVQLGARKRLKTRLVAIRLPEEVAQERRRKARNDRHSKVNHSEDYYERLGWCIFITNIPLGILSALQITKVYRFRWRIEIIFKVWKSKFNFDGMFNKTSMKSSRAIITFYHRGFGTSFTFGLAYFIFY